MTFYEQERRAREETEREIRRAVIAAKCTNP